MQKFSSTSSFSVFVVMVSLIFIGTHITNGQQTGPVNVSRDKSSPSIHEGIIQVTAGYKTDVNPYIGQLPASYSWLGGIGSAIGSIFQAYNINPFWLGTKSDQVAGQQSSYNASPSRTFAGVKGIGGKDVTDTAQLGTVCGKDPGDPYWVAFDRPGNVEIPPAYQSWHDQNDCYCRCGEMIDCPIQDYAGAQNWNVTGGGQATHKILCEECFGYAAHIRKHDYYVGKDIPEHSGYPVDAPNDPGYLECLRQSSESYGASNSGGNPSDPTLFGI